MDSEIHQAIALLDGLFQKQELMEYKKEYYEPIKTLLDNAKETHGKYMLDNIPHPKLCKLMIGPSLHYLDQSGNIYKPDSVNPHIAQLVGKFSDSEFLINEQVYPLKIRKVKNFYKDDTLFVDANNGIFDKAFVGSSIVGGHIGYVDSSGVVKVH
jgi:hypothetical protein